MSKRFPLNWPEGWKRTAPSQRVRAHFNKQGPQRFNDQGQRIYTGKVQLSVNDGVQRILGALRQFGVNDGDAIISTNVPVRLDGLPYSQRTEPADPGVAIYWKRNKIEQAMAIDRYDRVADNIAAVAATLEAMRAIERHGGAEILNRTFTGFAALPERAGGRGWRDVFEVSPQDHLNADAIRTRFNALAHKVHPDKPGGDRNKFEELIWARDAALREITEAARS